jgi:hypothetical protein
MTESIERHGAPDRNSQNMRMDIREVWLRLARGQQLLIARSAGANGSKQTNASRAAQASAQKPNG